MKSKIQQKTALISKTVIKPFVTEGETQQF